MEVTFQQVVRMYSNNIRYPDPLGLALLVPQIKHDSIFCENTLILESLSFYLELIFTHIMSYD